MTIFDVFPGFPLFFPDSEAGAEGWKVGMTDAPIKSWKRLRREPRGAVVSSRYWEGDPAQGHDDLRLDGRYLAVQERQADFGFVGIGVPIGRGADI